MLRDKLAAHDLSSLRWTRAEVVPIDARIEQVNFYNGAQVGYEAAVRSDGSVAQTSDSARVSVPYGSPIAYGVGLLIGMGALFVLMAAVVPFRRIRNLDVAMALSLVAPMVLFQHRYVDASAIVAVVPLGYLALRCGLMALGRSRPEGESTPLYESLTQGWSPRERVRVLRCLLAAAVLAFLMVGVSSTGVDVVYAVMEGATKIVHGVLPYGHLPGDVIHGDTYPILSYALYVPVALIAPVGSMWDSVDLALGVCVLAAIGAAACAFLATAGRSRVGRRAPEAELVGLRAALACLCFPPMLATVSTGTTDVLLGAMLALAIVLWQKPAASTAVIGMAGWFKLAPFALLPIWLAPLRGRQLVRALAGLAAVSAAALGLVIGLGGVGGLRSMVSAVGYQFNRGSFQSAWHALGIDGLQPFGEACVLALVIGGAIRLRRDPELAGDPRRLAALTAAVMCGVQLAANYWAFLYLAWIGPLLVVSMLADPVPVAQPVPMRLRSLGRVGRLVTPRRVA